MKIAVDKNQKVSKHTVKHEQLKALGHELVDIPSPVGDYFEITPEIEEVIKRRGDNLKKMDLIGLITTSIDTKRDISELYSCLIQSHKRFSDSCFLAKNNNIRFIILVENKNGFKTIEDIKDWKNPAFLRYWKVKKKCEKMGVNPPKPPASNVQLIKIMHSMSRDYGVEFIGCKPEETGAKIAELLGGHND